MGFHDGILVPDWRITTAVVYTETKQGKNKWLIQWISHQASQCHVWLGYAKTCAAHYAAQLLLPKYGHPHTISKVRYRLI